MDGFCQVHCLRSVRGGSSCGMLSTITLSLLRYIPTFLSFLTSMSCLVLLSSAYHTVLDPFDYHIVQGRRQLKQTNMSVDDKTAEEVKMH